MNLPSLLSVDEIHARFTEVIPTDGAITSRRKEAFLEITRAGGFKDTQVAFVTAYLDRGQPAFRKTVSELAWNSFAWFASEPESIIVLRGRIANTGVRLSDLCI